MARDAGNVEVSLNPDKEREVQDLYFDLTRAIKGNPEFLSRLGSDWIHGAKQTEVMYKSVDGTFKTVTPGDFCITVKISTPGHGEDIYKVTNPPTKSDGVFHRYTDLFGETRTSDGKESVRMVQKLIASLRPPKPQTQPASA